MPSVDWPRPVHASSGGNDGLCSAQLEMRNQRIDADLIGVGQVSLQILFGLPMLLVHQPFAPRAKFLYR